MTPTTWKRLVAEVTLVVTALTGTLAYGQSTLAATRPATLRVMSYNVHHGEGTDKRLDLDRIAGVIRAAAPDLVAVQEVDRNTDRTGGVDQAARLGELTGLRHAFAPALPYRGGEYGVAVLSRFPIEAAEVLKLPHGQREPRVALIARVRPDDAGAPPLTFVSVHLDHIQEDTLQLTQARSIVEHLAAERGPLIVAGDFNAQPASPTIQFVREHFREAGDADRPTLTFPATQPTRQIDYVFCRPHDRWEWVSTRAIDEPIASDHRPVVVELRMK